MKLGRKGINPRFPVLKEAFLYDDTVGPLLSHLRAYNTDEIKVLRRIAFHAANAIFEHVRDRLPTVDKEASLEQKQRHNDSVSWLRTRHIKTVNKIGASKFGYNL
jgi:hypothetical protein